MATLAGETHPFLFALMLCLSSVYLALQNPTGTLDRLRYYHKSQQNDYHCHIVQHLYTGKPAYMSLESHLQCLLVYRNLKLLWLIPCFTLLPTFGLCISKQNPMGDNITHICLCFLAKHVPFTEVIIVRWQLCIIFFIILGHRNVCYHVNFSAPYCWPFYHWLYVILDILELMFSLLLWFKCILYKGIS